MNPFGNWPNSADCCCEQIRVIYVHNLSRELYGRVFQSELEMTLFTNISPRDHYNELMCMSQFQRMR